MQNRLIVFESRLIKNNKKELPSIINENKTLINQMDRMKNQFMELNSTFGIKCMHSEFKINSWN